MIDKEVIAEVQNYMTREMEDRYAKFCTYVVEKCKEVKEKLGANVVNHVYSRAAKQGGIALKSNHKIAKKVSEKRKQDKSYKPKDVTDIVGVTLVVNYPDQIKTVLNTLKDTFDAEDITFKKAEEIEKAGYYATHVDLYSSLKFRRTYCELQIKTMLLDSWSTKMHDLNYKPSGSLDSRLDRLMESLGRSVHAIELQSETVRNLIQERWKQDKHLRDIVRAATIRQFAVWSGLKGILDGEAQSIINEINQIADWSSQNSKAVELTKRVSSLSEKSSRRAWWIATLLAVQSERQECFDLAVEIIHEWMDESAGLRKDPQNTVDDREIYFVPLACQAIGYNDLAISFSEDIIHKFNFSNPDSIKGTKFNLAHFLIEREYFFPSDSDIRAKAAADVRTFINESESLREEDPSCFADLEGMELVTFGETPDKVRAGITLIEAGRATTNPNEVEFAEKNYELHARLAWRRLSELENSTN